MAALNSSSAVSLLSIVLFLSLIASAVRLANPLATQYQKPPPNLFRPQRIKPVLRRVVPSLTRLPNRPLPVPVPAAPYLMINVSWQRPSIDVATSSPFSRSPHRAEYDTAIMFAGEMEAFGAGCNATFSRRSSDVLFSGDDVYAPGWEAYRVSLSQVQAIGQSVYMSTLSNALSTAEQTAFSYDKSLLIYVARQSDFKTQFVIDVSVHSASGGVVAHTSLTMADAPTMTDICAVSSGRSASLHLCPGFGCVLLTNETDSVVLQYEETPEPLEPSISPMPTSIVESAILDATPVPISDPYPRPTVISVPFPYSAAASSTHVLVKVSWSTPVSAFTDAIRWYSYASAGVKLIGENDSLLYTTCSTTYPGDIVFMPHKSYEPTGDVEFLVNLDLLLDNSSITSTWFAQDSKFTDITLVAFGDWYYKFNEYGSMSVSATLIGPGGNALKGEEAHLVAENVVPGVSGSCAPWKQVAKFVVRRNRRSETYHLSSLKSDTAQSGDIPAPSVPSPEPTGLFSFENMETPEPIIGDVGSGVFLEPAKIKFPPVLNSTSLLITVSWSTPLFYMEMLAPTPYWDLETGINLPQYYGDYFVFDTCQHPARFGPLYTSPNDHSSNGSESFLVDLNHFADRSNSTDRLINIDIIVYASWYKIANYLGDVTVSLKLLGPGAAPLNAPRSSAELNGFSIGAADECTPISQIAVATVQFDREWETFSIESLVDIYETMVMNPMERTGSRRGKTKFPPVIKSTSLLITTSWSTPPKYIAAHSANIHYWDLETGISLPQYHGEWFMIHTCSSSLINGPIYRSYNNLSATGSESFLVDLNHYVDSSDGVTSNSKDRFVHIVIVVHADWFRQENNAGQTSISLKLLRPGGQPLKGPGSSTELKGISPGSTKKCRPKTSVAKLTVRFDRKKKTFTIPSFVRINRKQWNKLTSKERTSSKIVEATIDRAVNANAEAPVEPFIDIYDNLLINMIPTEQKVSKPSMVSFYPKLKSTSLLITTSWITPPNYIATHSNHTRYFDLETGISLPQYHGDWVIFHTCQYPSRNGPVYMSHNNLSATGSESFLVDLNHYVDSSDVVSSNSKDRFVHIVIVVHADWFHEENNAGQASISLKVLDLNGQPLKGPGTFAELKGISPGSINKCRPQTPVASITVRFDRQKKTFSIPSFVDRNRKHWNSLKPNAHTISETVEETIRETLVATVEATVEPPPSALVFPNVELHGELHLAVTFTWPNDVIDLDSQVWLSSLGNGVGCNLDNTSTVLFGGDSTITGGKERFSVLVGKAKNDGRWLDLIDVTLAAYWFARDEYNGSAAEVRVDLMNEVDEMIDSAQMTFSPYWHNRVQKPFCGTNKIGRVRVVDNNGTVSMKLGIY